MTPHVRNSITYLTLIQYKFIKYILMYIKRQNCKKHKKDDISYLIEQHGDIILVPREYGQLAAL